MTPSRREFLRLAPAVAAVHAFSGAALAQDYPSRPVTLVAPYAAGGSADILPRLIAESKLLLIPSEWPSTGTTRTAGTST